MKKIYFHLLIVLMAALLPLLGCIPQKNVRAAVTDPEKMEIYDASNDSFFTVTDHEFLIGAIATEMPVTFHPEALKAQGVAAYTYYKKLTEDGGAVSADPDSFYIYTGKDQLMERWGDNFEEYYGLLSDIADEIEGQALFSDGELITASYYAISGGNTEASADIWGGERSYLQAVASPWDCFAAGYYTEKTMPLTDAAAVMLNLAPGLAISPDSLIENVERSPSGSVLRAQVGGQTVSGEELREAFGLRSQNFTWEIGENDVTFCVKGWGHGVGMSQTGANYLAGQGYTCREILAYYYPGAEMKKI